MALMQNADKLMAVATRLDDLEKTNADYVVPSALMRFNEDESLSLGAPVDRAYHVNDVAFAQIYEKAGIDKRYIDRMRNGHTGLMAHNINYWFSNMDDRSLVRTNDATARAVLSDTYRPLDNIDLFNAIMPTLHKLTDEVGLSVVEAAVSDRRLYIKLISERQIHNVKVGQTVQNGAIIGNSEVGQGSIFARRFGLNLSCLNGAVMEHAFRKVHLGKRLEAEGFYSKASRMLEDAAFWSKLKDSLEWVFDETEFHRTMENADALAKMPLSKPAEVVQVIVKRNGLPKASAAALLNNMISGGDPTAWGMVNAVTALAHSADPDDSYDLQRAGGALMLLPPSQWMQIAAEAERLAA